MKVIKLTLTVEVPVQSDFFIYDPRNEERIKRQINDYIMRAFRDQFGAADLVSVVMSE